MFRLLIFVFVSLSLFSCEDVYTKDDELFYQISEADSARCMEEILDRILEEAAEKQIRQEERMENAPVCCGCYMDALYIVANSSGQVMFQNELVSGSISDKVYRFFMCNRFLTAQETIQAITDINYPGFEFAFYNRFTMEEIDREVEKARQRWLEVKNTEGADSAFVDYYYSKVEEWQTRKKALKTIEDSELPEISQSAILSFEYPKESEKSKRVMKDIVFAFYQMRNYECMRYFGETYVNLYARVHRLNRKIDKRKLEALQVLHPARIYSFEGRNPWYAVEAVPIPTP